MARPVEEKFELLELLGEGAAGTVHRARLRETGEEVALKVLHGVEVGIPQTRERFAQEAKLLMRVRSPYVVRAVTAGAVEGRMYLAMEFVRRARDLGTWAREEQPDPTRAREVCAGIAEGLAAVHDVGVVHRDLKPANVLVGVDDVPRLADFGLAKSQEGGVRTATGLVLGTPGYMAPEVLTGKRPSPAADVYALGATLYFLITLRPLFDQEDLGALVDAQRAGPSQEALGALSPEDTGLVRWLTAPTPEDRPEALRAAEGLRRGRAPAAAKTMAAAALPADEAATQVVPEAPARAASARAGPPPPRPEGSVRRGLLRGLTLGLCLLGLGSWVLLDQAPGSSPPPSAPPEPPPPATEPPSMDAWARQVLDLPPLSPLQLLEGAGTEVFGTGGSTPTDELVDLVTSALLAPPGAPEAAAYREAVEELGQESGWRHVLGAAPPPGTWWQEAADQEGRALRRKLARRLQAIWPLEATIDALGATRPRALEAARAVLAPVLPRPAPARLGATRAGAPLEGLAGRCWAFLAAELGRLADLAAVIGDPTPAGQCQDWSGDRTSLATVMRGGDLAPVDRDQMLNAPGPTVAVPPGDWIEVTAGFFDLHPTTALVLRLESEDGEDYLDLPFHVSDQALARAQFLPAKPGASLLGGSKAKGGMVHQTWKIRRSLLPEAVRVRVWVQPLALEIRMLRQMTLTAATARGCLVSLTWRPLAGS